YSSAARSILQAPSCARTAEPTNRGTTKMKSIAAATLAVVLLATMPARAEDAMGGIWIIERAEPAPWVDATFKPDQKEVATYVGKTVKFLAHSIKAPALLACPN